ncbi:unnamed protein product [Staurois parvus]|uniref:Histone H4 n=1 Tax=Staurois parvus TaxID=386267 RepID=A0ABN9BGF8_9NEOB|nr:unnamed protein product [Staurois parvus]
MSGHGKGGKSLGKGGAKFHRKVLWDNITKPTPTHHVWSTEGESSASPDSSMRSLLQECHLRCHCLYRACKEEDRHCHGCRLFSQMTGMHALQIQRLNLDNNLPYFSLHKTHFFPPKKGGKCQCVLWSEYKAAGLVFLPPPCQNTGPAAQLFSPAGPYLFLAPALYSLPALASVTAGCPLRMLLRFVNGPVSSGTHDRSQKAPGRSQSTALLAHAQWAPGCHRSRLGKKREGQLRESGSGYLSNSGTCSPSLPKGQQSLVISFTVCSLWSSPALSAVSGYSLHSLQSLVIPCTVCSLWSSVLCPWYFPCTTSAVSGHFLYCVRSLWSSPVLCSQSLVIPVLCPQSLVIPCTVSAVSGHLLYYFSSLWSFPVVSPQSLVISCTMSTVSGHSL